MTERGEGDPAFPPPLPVAPPPVPVASPPEHWWPLWAEAGAEHDSRARHPGGAHPSPDSLSAPPAAQPQQFTAVWQPSGQQAGTPSAVADQSPFPPPLTVSGPTNGGSRGGAPLPTDHRQPIPVSPPTQPVPSGPDGSQPPWVAAQAPVPQQPASWAQPPPAQPAPSKDAHQPAPHQPPQSWYPQPWFPQSAQPQPAQSHPGQPHPGQPQPAQSRPAQSWTAPPDPHQPTHQAPAQAAQHPQPTQQPQPVTYQPQAVQQQAAFQPQPTTPAPQQSPQQSPQPWFPPPTQSPPNHPDQVQPTYPQPDHPPSGYPTAYQVPDQPVHDVDSLIDDLRRDARPHRSVPRGGWRGAAYRLTGGAFNPGPPASELRRTELVEMLRAPLIGAYSVPVLSGKGGVGKTTTVVALGSYLAMYRADRVLAIDANPDGGSLFMRVPRVRNATIHDLRDLLRVRALTPTEIDAFVNYADTRLGAIIAAPRSPSRPLTSQEYRMLLGPLRDISNIILTDCGTDISAPVMRGVLTEANQIVVASSTVEDEAAVVAATLDDLCQSGFEALVRSAVTVIALKSPTDRHAERIVNHFRERTRAVVMIPYDERVRSGGVFDPSAVGRATDLAYLRAAAEVVAGLTAR